MAARALFRVFPLATPLTNRRRVVQEPADSPAVMLSSTVLDFADLRSVLSLWPEENGCIVSVSEANDVDMPIGPGAVESGRR
jgi:hypothetical protein